MAKTRIVSTNKGEKSGKRKKGFKHMTRKVKKSHKGYPMKSILKGQMTYKGKGKKR